MYSTLYFTFTNSIQVIGIQTNNSKVQAITDKLDTHVTTTLVGHTTQAKESEFKGILVRNPKPVYRKVIPQNNMYLDETTKRIREALEKQASKMKKVTKKQIIVNDDKRGKERPLEKEKVSLDLEEDFW